MNKTALLTAAQVYSVIDMGPHVIELFLVPKHPFLTAICDYCKKKKLQYVDYQYKILQNVLLRKVESQAIYTIKTSYKT